MLPTFLGYRSVDMTGRLAAKGLVILDRDGVINRDSPEFVKNTDEWRPISGSIEAIAKLSKGGYTVTVASNQSGLARGLFDRNALRAMHRKLRRLVIAEIAAASCAALRHIARWGSSGRRLASGPRSGGGGRRCANTRADRKWQEGRHELAGQPAVRPGV
jgi:lambda repressor-like predicted transcriptional regulator